MNVIRPCSKNSPFFNEPNISMKHPGGPSGDYLGGTNSTGSGPRYFGVELEIDGAGEDNYNARALYFFERHWAGLPTFRRRIVPMTEDDLWERAAAPPGRSPSARMTIPTEQGFHSPEGKLYQPSNWKICRIFVVIRGYATSSRKMKNPSKPCGSKGFSWWTLTDLNR